MSDQYIRILKESLCRKIEILKELLSFCNEQANCVKKNEPDWEHFDYLTDQKEKYISELNKLDEGFELVFARVKEVLDQDKSKHQEDILFMKKCIAEITTLSTSVEATERRNKTLIENVFTAKKKEYGKKTISAKAAASYYQNTNRINYVDPQLLDHKK